VPATASAAAASPAYAPGAPLALLLEQLREGWAVPRPRSPAYPFASSVFQDAFAAIRTGEDVRSVLAEAAKTIDDEIEDNRGFVSPGPGPGGPSTGGGRAAGAGSQAMEHRAPRAPRASRASLPLPP